MHSDVQLSTRFVTAQNQHQVRMLIKVGGDAPVDRPPINVALVLDRSGSMGGQPLHEAKQAALRFSEFLAADDRLSIVVFDDQVETVYGPGPARDPSVVSAIASIATGGTTNLSGGWLKGREHVAGGLVDGTNRVVLLTDGLANRGITDLDQLVGLARGAQQDRVSTSCIGFGPQFNEDLLSAMSDAGSGNFLYVENFDQMGAMFEEEIEGLVALAAQNLEISVHLADPRVQGVTFAQSFPVNRTDDGVFITSLGDLYATSDRALGMIFHVEDVTELGKVPLGEVKIAADVLVEEGVEHRVLTMPVVANLDGEDHVEPEVESTLVRFEAARAREEAVRQADRGDFDGAALCLRQATRSLEDLPSTPVIREEIDDLRVEAARMEESQYDAADRKYHMGRAYGSMRDKDAYIAKMSRPKRRRRKPETSE